MKDSVRMFAIRCYEMEKVPRLCFKVESAGTHFGFLPLPPPPPPFIFFMSLFISLESWKPVGSLPSAFPGQVPMPW